MSMQGNTEHDHKKLRQSSGPISKLNEDEPGRSQSPSNQIRKVYFLITSDVENETINQMLYNSSNIHKCPFVMSI